MALSIFLLHLPATHPIFDHAGFGRLVVYVFFLMSGYVLARGYDGRPGVFVLRRLVRLWPVYAACMLAGHALAGTAPIAAELAWLPSALTDCPAADPPAWSLFAEAWATFFLLPMFAIARRSPAIAWATPAAAFLLIFWNWRLYPMAIFAAGVAASALPLRWPARMPAWALWLGKISFSLYLSHWLVIEACIAAFGPAGGWIAGPLGLVVAWGLYVAIEQPSIAVSRAIGRVASVREEKSFFSEEKKQKTFVIFAAS